MPLGLNPLGLHVGCLSDIFRMRNETRLHEGADIAAPCGTPIHATHDGYIYSVNFQKGAAGNYIYLANNNSNHPDFKTFYAHLPNLPNYKAGDFVRKGDVIGVVGNTGNSTGATGCHLHYGIYDRNGQPGPTKILEKGEIQQCSNNTWERFPQ